MTKIHPRLTGGSRGCASFRSSRRLYKRWSVSGTNGSGSWMLPSHVVARGVGPGRLSAGSRFRVCLVPRGVTWPLPFSQLQLQEKIPLGGDCCPTRMDVFASLLACLPRTIHHQYGHALLDMQDKTVRTMESLSIGC